MKFCVDCKHHTIDTFWRYCKSPENGISLITGKIDQNLVEFLRDNDEMCGTDGKWFVEHKPFWRIWS